jgi:hypothetical protein
MNRALLTAVRTACYIAASLSTLSQIPVVQAGGDEKAVHITKNAELEQIRVQHQQILNAMNARDKDGKAADLDDPKMPSLLKAGWHLAGLWAAEYFDSNPRPSRRELDRIFDGFSPEPQGYKSKYGDFLEYRDYHFTGSAVRVGSDIYVVEGAYALDFPSTGTFMVVARDNNGHFRALWNVKDLAEKHYDSRDEIGRWMHLTRRAYYNGPLNVGMILPLPTATTGHVRFLVNAYQVADGSTQISQISIWEWDGMEANPLLIGLYQFALDKGGFHFDGKTIKIITKEEVSSFYTTSPDPEPRGSWTIRVKPDAILDMGRRFEKPELQWADELFSKIHKGDNVSDIADAKVTEYLKKRMKEVQSETLKRIPSWDPNWFSWGELRECKILHRGQRGAFELSLDEGLFHFDYILRNGKAYFINVSIT